jgi:nucleoside-specific outer membrane channel protein Tsx|tara:strand:- start:96 stop:572 length:477 start_codon:yes stop_codon:yes gene_type:complete
MNMKKVSLDVWIQLLGMLSVLAGLVFVGLEMRQSQRIALAAQQQERASLVTEIIGTFSETNPPISFLDFLNENLDVSNQNNRAVAETYIYRMWMVYENDYLQYELGLMDEDIWLAKLAAMRNVYGRCQYREVTARALSFSSADLLTLLDDTNIRLCEE